MAITINKKLNLVIPIDNEGIIIWFHIMPLSREVFESNYLLLTRTLSNLYGNGAGPAMAPRIAALMLRDSAKEMENPVASMNLINEIYRLTNVLMPSTNGGGWQTYPYSVVKNQKMVDEEILSEVENAIVFFIVASAIHLKSELPMACQGLKSVWKAETTSLDITAYMNSLRISTTEENIGENPIPTPIMVSTRNPSRSSIPS
jgi:hypothetical protein